MQRVCDTNQQQAATAIRKEILSFENKGQSADFMSLRGTKEKSYLFKFTGPRTFAFFTPLYFEPDRELSNTTIKAIEVVGANRLGVLTPGIDNVGNTLEGYLYLYDKCEELIAQLPLSSLNRDLNGGKITFTNFKNLDWANCYIYAVAGSGAANNGILFNIYF